MSKRNLVWLAVIVGVTVIAWIALGALWGIVLGVVTLLASEAIERVRRRKRQVARGEEPHSPVRTAMTQRKPRR
jgi:hypothetical protein